jgi:hypothetical protein
MQHKSLAVNFDADKEYRAIESALLETARGRWFLSEHGRRARRLDGVMLEEAIARLQSSIRQPPALLGQLKAEVDELTEFVRETRSALMARPGAGAATTRGTSPAETSAASGILKAAEDMHEAAWTLQAHSIDPASCESIARNAAVIYALSQQQAVESQRAIELSEALDRAIARLAAMRETILHELEVDRGGALPTDIEV